MKLGLVGAVVAAAALAAGCGHSTAPVRDDFVGVVSDDLLHGNAHYRMENLARQRRAGIRLVRQTILWSEIERAPGRFDFSVYDSYVAALAAQRMDLLPILIDPPDFRSRAPARGRKEGVYPPRRDRDFGRFTAAVARRYGPRGSFWRANPSLPRVPVTSWQIWNEPNIPAYWASGPDPHEYVRLLAAGAGAIRSVDPKAEIVSAGVAESKLGPRCPGSCGPCTATAPEGWSTRSRSTRMRRMSRRRWAASRPCAR